MAEKLSHAEVDYRDGTTTRRCELCTMYRPGPSCTAVKGPIRDDGQCDIFRRRSKSAAERSAGRYGKRS